MITAPAGSSVLVDIEKVGLDNIFDTGGFQMIRNKPIETGGEEVTEVFSSRGGRTFSISLKYNFGKIQEEKRRQKGFDRGGEEGGMDMGY